jgi:hypothetical protein
MPKEIKILIPESNKNETVDIKVMRAGESLVKYRLEVYQYSDVKHNQSRADFAKKCIDSYSSEYEVVEIGLDGENLIPVLYRQKSKR